MQPETCQKDILMIDNTTKKTLSLFLTTNEKIYDVRQQICDENQWKNVEFKFVGKSGSVFSKGAQKKKMISQIIHEDKFFIQSENESTSKSSKQDVLKIKEAQAKQHKAKISQMLCQVEDFEKKYQNQGKQKISEKRKDLQYISDKLKALNISASFQTETIDFRKLKQNLMKIQRDNDAFLAQLKDITDIKTEELIQNFARTIAFGKYSEKDAKQSAVWWEKTRIEYDNSSRGYESIDLTFQSLEESEHYKKNHNQTISTGSVSVYGITLSGLVKAGVQYSASQSQHTAKKTNKLGNYFKNMRFSVYCGQGVIISAQNLKIKPQVADEYTQLLKKYISNKETNNFKQQIIEFLQRYGYEIQVGMYLLGNYYKAENQLTFKEEKSYMQRLSIANNDLHFAIAGGMIFQGGAISGKGCLNHQGNSGQQQTQAKKNQEYSSTKKINANPAVNIESDWKNLVILKKNEWKVLGKDTQTVNICLLMRTKLNATELVKQCTKNQTIYNFEKCLREIYIEENFKAGEGPKKKQNQINVALIGSTGAGKSYFGNQLIGSSIDQPFKSSDKTDSQTFHILKQSKGNFNIYDTPGLFDNTSKFKSPGQLQRKICSIVNTGISKDYKFISGFLVVVKVIDRIIISQTLLKMIEMFGRQSLKSTIFVFNMASQKHINMKKEQIKKNPEINELKNYCPTFNFDTQLFFNYKFDDKKSIKDQLEDYRIYEARLLKNIQTLPLYDSEIYKNYIEQLKKQQKDKDQRERERIQNQLRQRDQLARKLKVQNYFKNMSNFKLYQPQTKRYIKHGMIPSSKWVVTWLGIAERGFTLGQQSILFLDDIQINYEKGYIQGFLGDQSVPDRIAATNPDKCVGYQDRKRPSGIQTVKIQFENKSKGMESYCEGLAEKVKIFLVDGYLIDDNEWLKRSQKGDIFHMKHV